MARLSSKLKDLIEDQLDLTVIEGPTRIYGLKGAAHRWSIRCEGGLEFTGEDSMADCVKSGRLGFVKDGPHTYISVE